VALVETQGHDCVKDFTILMVIDVVLRIMIVFVTMFGGVTLFCYSRFHDFCSLCLNGRKNGALSWSFSHQQTIF